MKYAKGLVIGRFQPFHKGHLYLIQKALELCDTIQIGIGSVNKSDILNPFPFNVRKQFLNQFIKHEKLQKKVTGIYALYDNPSDDIWLKKVIKELGTPEIVIGNNDWVNGIFKDAKIPVKKITYCNRKFYEGAKIRELIKNGGNWEDRVPEYLVDVIKKHSKIRP